MKHITDEKGQTPEETCMTNSHFGPEGKSEISRISLPEHVWQLFIAITTIAVLAVSIYFLEQGITIIFMHLFYFPIILLSYHYRYRGFLFALLLALAYVWLVYFFDNGNADVITGAWLRFLVFAGIAAVVAYLSEHLSEDKKILQESEQKYRTLFENMLEGFAFCRMIYDSNGRPVDWVYLDVNAAFGQLTGLNDIRGKRILEVIPDIRKLNPELFDTYGRVATTGISEKFEIDFKPLKKLLRVSVFSPKKGYFVAVFEDISEQRQAEDEIRKARDFYLKVLDDFPNPIWRADVTAKCDYFNRNWLDFTGRTLDQELGDGWAEGVHPDDFERCLKIYLENFHARKPFEMEYRLRYRDGTYHWLYDSGKPFYTLEGKFAGYIGSCYDIESRKQAEADLLRSEEKYRSILKASPDDITITDLSGIIHMVSPAALIIFGFGREEDVLGRPITDFLVVEDRKRAAENLALMLSGTFTGPGEYRAVHTSGRTINIEANADFIRNPDGTPESIVIVIRDITERKRAEQAFVEVNKKLNLLSSITRHDINNQLFSLKAFLALSKESLGNTAETAEYLMKAERAAHAIERQILFTKEYQDLGINAPVWQSVEESLENSRNALPLRDIRLTASVKDLEVFADPLFEKVFYNLIDNALRYGGPKMTTIRITAQESGQNLVISVEDDGAGISAEDKKRLFERGFGHNTGLGLFLSREILAITGITIAENGEPGKGARFGITVPQGSWRYTMPGSA
jgi:PAS domain S-box-containing protein